jgi:hypothetical protein
MDMRTLDFLKPLSIMLHRVHVMVPENEPFVAIEPVEDTILYLANLAVHGQIPEVPHMMAWLDHLVPPLDEHFIHF